MVADLFCRCGHAKSKHLNDCQQCGCKYYKTLV